MKSLRNKVILSGIVLVFAFIATIGSTYAWFTVATETSVEALDMQVTAADNLLIRVKNYTDDSDFEADELNLDYWTTSLTQDQLIDAGYLYENITGSIATSDLAYNTPWRLKPATIIQPGYGSYDATSLSYLGSLTDQDRTLTEINEAIDVTDFNDNNGYYIKLELYLLSQSDTVQNIELDSGVTSIYAANADSNLDIVANATRLSIWMDDTVLGQTGGTGVGSAFVYGNDTDYGYDFTGGEGALTSGTASALTTPDYFNNIDNLLEPIAGLSTSVIDIQTGAMDTNIYALQPNTPTLVSILIYIEGWDQQTTNAIVNALFNISFGFKFEE